MIKLFESQKAPVIVIPVKTGIQENQSRRETPAYAGVTASETFYESIKVTYSIVAKSDGSVRKLVAFILDKLPNPFSKTIGSPACQRKRSRY